MEKIQRMKITIGILTLACIGLMIAVIVLAVNDQSKPEVSTSPSPTTLTTKKITTTTTPGTTTEMQSTSAPGVITDDDLRSLSEELLKSDVNNMAKFITINVNANPDEGESFLKVEEEVWNCLNIQALVRLYGFFKAPVDINDNLGDEYFTEKNDFLDLIMKTEIMKITEDWTTKQGIFGSSNTTLRDAVEQIWFMPYAGSHSNSGVNDSTGFEHTFVGQRNGDRIYGLHNWVRFSELEQGGNITFGEFYNQTTFDGDGENKGSVLKISYDWEDASKDPGTMFVGTSPELEMALYTVCFFARPNIKCPMQMNGKNFTITTMDYNHLGVISVANPNI